MLSATQRAVFTTGGFQKDISLWEQRFGSCRAVVTGKYISPDLVCFGCFGDSVIIRARGLAIGGGSLYFFIVQPLPFILQLFLPVLLSFLPPCSLLSSLMLCSCKAHSRRGVFFIHFFCTDTVKQYILFTLTGQNPTQHHFSSTYQLK